MHTLEKQRLVFLIHAHFAVTTVLSNKKSKVVDLYSASSWNHLWCATVSRKSALISASQPDSQ